VLNVKKCMCWYLSIIEYSNIIYSCDASLTVSFDVNRSLKIHFPFFRYKEVF